MFGKKRKTRPVTEVNSGSMADIAFLLLIFFLVTTTIASDKGISVLLPPKKDTPDEVKMKERNIFNVLVNSNDQLLVEEEPLDISRLKAEAKKFISNNGADPASSEDPNKAVISLKADRGTSYRAYISVRDLLKQAYAELRAEHLGITLERYTYITENKDKEPKFKEMYDKAREKYPEQVSDAEPTNVGSN